MKITFLGDIMLGRFIDSNYFNNKYTIVDENIVQKINKSNYIIANLESPVLSAANTIDDHIRFMGRAEILEQFQWIDYFSLSNNHINDCDTLGMDQTVKSLNEYNIKWNGLYKDNNYKPITLYEKNEKIAIITCADTMNIEFSKNNKWETIRINEPILDQTIKEYKKKGYFIILFAHMGILFSRYPSPLNRSFAHEKIDIGVDSIVTVHSHCLGGMEIYKGKHIFYSLGDFVMDGNSFRRRRSGILTIDITNGNLENWNLIPAQINSNLQTELPNKKIKKKILSGFQKVSQTISKKDKIYNSFYKKQYKIELFNHSISTILFILRTKGVFSLLKLFWIRINDVNNIFRRLINRTDFRNDLRTKKHLSMKNLNKL